MGVETVLGVVGGVAGTAIQAGAAGDAANAQTAAAQGQINFQQGVFDEIMANLGPYQAVGPDALAAYQYELGLLQDAPTIGATPLAITEINTPAGPAAPIPGGFGGYGGSGNGEDGYVGYGGGPRGDQRGYGGVPGVGTTQWQVGDQVFDSLEDAEAYAQANAEGGFTYGGYQASPGYEWALSQGQGAINALAGAQGGLVSGATLQNLAEFNQGVASQDWNQYMASLGGLIDTGAGAATAGGNFGQNTAAAVGSALAGMGNAQAAGSIAQGNAWNQGLNNLTEVLSYQNALTQQPYNPSTGSGAWWLGTG